MAVTISLAELAAALRIGDGTTAPSGPVGIVLRRVSATATVLVEHYASAAPEPLQNEAAVRLAGWLYDSDPSGRSFGGPSAIRSSGAGALLSPYRVRRARRIGLPDEDKEVVTMGRLEVFGGSPTAVECSQTWTPPPGTRRVVLVVLRGTDGGFTVEARIAGQWVPIQFAAGQNPVELRVYESYRLCSTAPDGAEVLFEARGAR